MVPGPSVFPSREPSVSGNFCGRIKGVKYRFALQGGTWDFPGTSLETPGTSVFPWSETGMLGNFGVASRVPSSISNCKMLDSGRAGTGPAGGSHAIGDVG